MTDINLNTCNVKEIKYLLMYMTWLPGYIISPFFYSWPISLFLFSFFNSLNSEFFSDIHFKFAFAQSLSVARVYYKPIFLFLKTENPFFYSTKTLKNIFLFLIKYSDGYLQA